MQKHNKERVQVFIIEYLDSLERLHIVQLLEVQETFSYHHLLYHL